MCWECHKTPINATKNSMVNFFNPNEKQNQNKSPYPIMSLFLNKMKYYF